MSWHPTKWLGLALVSLGICAAQPGYVDPLVCATCHRSIAESYARTGMGRSFGAVQTNTFIPAIQGDTFHHEPSDQFFSLSAGGGKRSLKRYERGFDGAPANVLEASLDYRIGSGNQ